MRRLLTPRGWLAAGALALLLIACAVHAASADTTPPTLDHPWSRLP